MAGSRPTALRFALGISVVQVLWVARIFLLDESAQFWTFFVLVALELAHEAVIQLGFLQRGAFADLLDDDLRQCRLGHRH